MAVFVFNETLLYATVSNDDLVNNKLELSAVSYETGLVEELLYVRNTI